MRGMPDRTNPTDAQIPEFIRRAVKQHGTLAVLRALINATDDVAGVLGHRGDVVGANDILRRNDILKRAYKEWQR